MRPIGRFGHQKSNRKSSRKVDYRLEMLPVVPAYHRHARRGRELEKGELVYYGPCPKFYGIGEVKRVVGRFVAVNFRGTGLFGVHEEVIERQYILPIPPSTMSLL